MLRRKNHISNIWLSHGTHSDHILNQICSIVLLGNILFILKVSCVVHLSHTGHQLCTDLLQLQDWLQRFYTICQNCEMVCKSPQNLCDGLQICHTLCWNYAMDGKSVTHSDKIMRWAAKLLHNLQHLWDGLQICYTLWQNCKSVTHALEKVSNCLQICHTHSDKTEHLTSKLSHMLWWNYAMDYKSVTQPAAIFRWVAHLSYCSMFVRWSAILPSTTI